MVATYDAIVVGLGAMGSAAAYHLSRRGCRVLGVEAFGRGHTLGSSHGESRVIRQAYFEHPDYVPLLRRAYALWDDLAREARQELLRRTGGVFIGPPEGALVAGSRRSAREHGLPHEILDAAEVRRRYPALRVSEADVAIHEPAAGILYPEQCIEAHLRLAAQAGAELRFEEPVTAWTADQGGGQVETARGRYAAGRLVFTAGAWLGKLLADLDLPLEPERVPLFWLHPRVTPELFSLDRFPIWLWDTGEAGIFYGFPHLEWPGVKLARHHSGEPCDAETVRREVTPEDEARLRRFVRRCIPALDGPVALAKVCLYTNTPDEHFVVDRHPDLPPVVYGGGFSGHGFKFASVIGEILASLAVEGTADPAAGFLRRERLGGGAARRHGH